MGTYAGITFEVMAEGQWRPCWHREQSVSRRHLPGSNKDDVQFGGLGNWRIAVTASLTDDDDATTLYAAVGPTLRALTDFLGAGDDYANVMLSGVSSPKRHPTKEVWLIELEFERAGA